MTWAVRAKVLSPAAGRKPIVSSPREDFGKRLQGESCQAEAAKRGRRSKKNPPKTAGPKSCPKATKSVPDLVFRAPRMGSEEGAAPRMSLLLSDAPVPLKGYPVQGRHIPELSFLSRTHPPSSARPLAPLARQHRSAIPTRDAERRRPVIASVQPLRISHHPEVSDSSASFGAPPAHLTSTRLTSSDSLSPPRRRSTLA